MLEGLLVLSRDVPGRAYALTRARVDFSRLLEQTTATFATVAAERGVGIEEDIEADLVVDGDAQLLRWSPSTCSTTH